MKRPKPFQSIIFLLGPFFLVTGCAKSKKNPQPPQYLEALTQANKAERAREYSVASLALQDALSHCLPKDCPSTQFRYAKALLFQKKHQKAYEVFLEISEIYPQSNEAPFALMEAGKIIESLDVKKARELYLQVIITDPESAAAKRASDRLLFRARKAGGSTTVTQEIDAIQAILTPQDRLFVSLLFFRASLHDELGQKEQALEDDEKVFSAGPSFPYYDDAAFRLSKRYEHRGEIDKAKTVLKTLLSHQKNAWFLGSNNKPYYDDAALRLGDLYRDTGEEDMAKRFYEDLLRRFPASILYDDALFRLALLQSISSKKRCKILTRLLKERPESRYQSEAKEMQNALECQ